MIELTIKVESENVIELKQELVSFLENFSTDKEDEREYVEDLSVIKIDWLNQYINTRAYLAMMRNSISSFGDLVKIEPAELLSFRSFGPKYYNEVVYGLSKWLEHNYNPDLEIWVYKATKHK